MTLQEANTIQVINDQLKGLIGLFLMDRSCRCNQLLTNEEAKEISEDIAAVILKIALISYRKEPMDLNGNLVKSLHLFKDNFDLLATNLEVGLLDTPTMEM